MSKKSSNTPMGLSRSLKILGTATRLATQELSHRIKKSTLTTENGAAESIRARVAQAKTLTTSLRQLKGAAMKAGQLLSLDASSFIPDEARDILSQLQSEAQFMDFDQVSSILKAELSEDVLLQIQDLSFEPIAAASIGQVHTALIKGERVAIKVQYPGVKDSIDTDLQLLRSLTKSFLGLSSKKIDTQEIFEELRTVLHQEADYQNELKFLKKFSTLVESEDVYRVPKPYDSFSTSKILTMSHESGVPLQKWIKTRPSVEKREYFAHNILNLYIKEFLEWGIVQTDPNFGNFLIRENRNSSEAKELNSSTPLEIVLLDFGASLEYPLEFREQYVEVLKSLDSRSTSKMFEAAVEFGLLDPRESKETQEAFKDMLVVSMRPFDPHLQPFYFGDEDFEKLSRETAMNFTKQLQYSSPPRKILFLHRKLGGVFNVLKRLDLRMDLRPYWVKMTEEFVPRPVQGPNSGKVVNNTHG